MPQLISFKPLLYVLLLIGVSAFSLASESPGLLMIGVGGILLNAWLVRTGRFRPLPRVAANLVTIAALVYVARELTAGNIQDRAVLVVGQFLVLLHIVKLWEQRQNRDYGQLLVLSPLLMVAAIIFTTSVLFGLLMVGYLLLALYVCLLFHLKVETDRAQEQGVAVPEPAPSPATVRRDRRLLNRSIRRLTSAVSIAGTIGAVVVFLFFPRGSGGATPGTPFGRGNTRSSTGLNNKIDYGRPTRIFESQEIVGHVKATHNGRWMGGGDVLYLRQTALDRYRVRRSGGQWVRESAIDSDLTQINRDSRYVVDAARDFPVVWPVPGAGPDDAAMKNPAFGEHAPRYEQHVLLTPTRQPELLAIAGITSVVPNRDMWLRSGSDGTVQAKEPPTSPIEYSVVSSGVVPVTERDLPSTLMGPLRSVVRAGFPSRGIDVENGQEFEGVLVRVSPLPAERGEPPVLGQQLLDLPRRARAGLMRGGFDGEFRSMFEVNAMLREGDLLNGDLVVEIDGRPITQVPAENRREVVEDAARLGQQITVLRNGRRRVLNSVAEPVTGTTAEDGVKVGSRAWAPPLLRAFGPREEDRIVAIDGVSIEQIPVADRVPAAIAALREGRPVAITMRDGRPLIYPLVPTEIEAHARRPDVSGTNEQGQSLASLRDRLRPTPDPIDREIARNIEAYLRTKFTYTLDLSDVEMEEGTDHLVWFLSDKGRRGHCTYFAGAMALMCQTLGLNARVAVGVRTDEYNPFSHEFVVRQSHAHAWVEVLTTQGWERFDPTSSRGTSAAATEYGLMQQLRHLFDWLESGYARNVLYYNNDSRDNLISSFEMQMTKPLYQGVNEGWITRRFSDSKLYKSIAGESGTLVRNAGIVAGLIAAAFVSRWLWRRWKLRRVAERVGLEHLPADERRRLARQLVFYDDLLQILERRQLKRRPSQTQLEFARSLVSLPADAYETVRRLTDIFYRVRYGHQTLGHDGQRRLAKQVDRLDRLLSAATIEHTLPAGARPDMVAAT